MRLNVRPMRQSAAMHAVKQGLHRRCARSTNDAGGGHYALISQGMLGEIYCKVLEHQFTVSCPQVAFDNCSRDFPTTL